MLTKLLSIAVICVFIGSTGALAFSQFVGTDVKTITSTAGYLSYKENGHLIEINESDAGTVTVTGPNGVVHTANGQPPGTDGKLGEILSVSNDIVYNVYVNNTAPGNWIEILFNITNEGSTPISVGFSGYAVSPSGATITKLSKSDFTRQGVFTPGGGWVFATTSIVPISPNSVHKVSSFFMYFGLASNTPLSFSQSTIVLTLTIDVSST
ncbi:MAG: hypothetical protein KIS30_03170 [Thermoplasmata archaeon]|nr:hypothetical protein [Candidatus Sysuiplasma acidicola]MBX8638536.1 hypothetical protein [Candidatus Sysuiplasma acidicola]MBX8645745.1 hypothetical protein [Candidatus Sysuiplasma acidicola]